MHPAMAANCHGSHATAAAPTASPNNKVGPLGTLNVLISSVENVLSGVDGAAAFPSCNLVHGKRNCAIYRRVDFLRQPTDY
jgi:hypothetical protein